MSAGAAVAGVAYGTLGLPTASPRPRLRGRGVLTRDFHLGRPELEQGSRTGLAMATDGLKLGQGRAAGHYLSPVISSGLPFHYLGLYWSGEYPEGSSVGFWVRTSADGRQWSGWQQVYVEMPPGPLARYDTYGSLIWADGARHAQILGELRGADGRPALHRVGLTVLNP